VALVTGQPRSASVETTEESRLIKVSKEEFDRLLDQNPQLARHIIHQLANWLVSGDSRLEKEVVHQVKLRQISWFDYALMIGLSLILSLVFNIYNENRIPLIYGWGEKDNIPHLSLTQAQDEFKKNELIFVDARKSAFYSQEHIKGAMNLPVVLFDLMFPMFQFSLEQTPGAKDKTLLVYGGSFSRRFDIELARALQHKGIKKVAVLNDYGGWTHTFPLVQKPPKEGAAISLGLAGLLEWLPVGIFVLILIPPIRRSPYLSAVCRLLLGAIFISFALSKILRPAVFALNTVDYGMMPSWGVNLWALALPWAELVVGLFLVLGIRTRAAATLIGAMNVIFIVGLVNAIFHHLPINCGCVGEVGEPVNWWKVLKNTGMLVMTVQIFLYDRFFVLDRGGFTLRERKI
jgi:uncharacterized membrane protein YphA (DoxX/SURF4 family)/rhodanese-related sulfurtransferase